MFYFRTRPARVEVVLAYLISKCKSIQDSSATSPDAGVSGDQLVMA